VCSRCIAIGKFILLLKRMPNPVFNTLAAGDIHFIALALFPCFPVSPSLTPRRASVRYRKLFSLFALPLLRTDRHVRSQQLQKRRLRTSRDIPPARGDTASGGSTNLVFPGAPAARERSDGGAGVWAESDCNLDGVMFCRQESQNVRPPGRERFACSS
jgi:hypothetical protein